MAILCPDCSSQYDVTLFQFGRAVRCDCGRTFHLDDANIVGPVRHRRPQPVRLQNAPREESRRLQRMADKVCSLILMSTYPDVDILIEMDQVRLYCQQTFPDRMDLYEMIYEARFKRLWQQFRPTLYEA